VSTPASQQYGGIDSHPVVTHGGPIQPVHDAFHGLLPLTGADLLFLIIPGLLLIALGLYLSLRK